MKQKFLFSNLVIAIASAMLIMSCSQEVTAPKPQQPTSTPPTVLNLVANHFEPQGPELVFKNTFTGVMQNRTTNPTVYVVTTDGETKISTSRANFMGGEIWSATTGSDLIIYYRNFSNEVLPFGYLNIKVVF